jgi:hypothetical protein
MSAAGDEEIVRAGFKLSFSYIHSFASRRAQPFRIPRLHAEYLENHRAFRLGMALAPHSAR